MEKYAIGSKKAGKYSINPVRNITRYTVPPIRLEAFFSLAFAGNSNLLIVV